MNNPTLEAWSKDDYDTFWHINSGDNGIDISKSLGEQVADTILSALNGQSIPKERLLEYIEERKQEYLGYNDITVLIDVDNLIEFIGSMEVKV